MEAMRSSWTVGPSKESKVEGATGPRQGLCRANTTNTWRLVCPQYQKCPETTSLLVGHSGTHINLPVPEDHQTPHLQTTLPETCLGNRPEHKDGYKNLLKLSFLDCLRILTCMPSMPRG